jgi:hypothetical protein
MKFDHELGHEVDWLNEQLEELERDLIKLESKVYELLQLYVDAKVAERSLSRKEAIALAGNLIRKAHDIRIRDRRASFKVIRAAPSHSPT